MKDILKIFILFLICSVFPACGDQNEDSMEGDDKETPWNKERTATVLVYSRLLDAASFSVSDNSKVSAHIKATTHSVAIIDRSDVSYSGNLISNPGMTIACDSKTVPFFVPMEKTVSGYKGSTVLLSHTLNNMIQETVEADCRLMKADTYAINNIPMNISTVSFNVNTQIERGLNIIKSKIKSSTVVIGVAKRSLVSELESKSSSILASGSYVFEKVNNSNQNSEYCIFILSSSKWKFRELSEVSVSGDIKCYQLKIESLK